MDHPAIWYKLPKLNPRVKASLKILFSNTYLSIDECHPETFDFHCRNGHQVLLAIRYIKEILVNE